MANTRRQSTAILEKASSRIRIFDHALGSGYNSLRRSDLLRRFLLASRRNSLQIVVHDTRTMDRNCPRILQLLRTYAHAISIHETHPAAKAVYDPFVIVDDRCFVHRFHFDEMRGLVRHRRSNRHPSVHGTFRGNMGSLFAVGLCHNAGACDATRHR
jgi:hypothetical protein